MYRASTPVTACPRCQHALEERTAGRETILACAACGGVWLDSAQTVVVFKRLAGDDALVQGSEDVAYFSRAQRPQTEMPATCPVGGEEMILCEAEGVRIDQCAEHGTWFDAHELGRIVKSADKPHAVTTWLSSLVGRKAEGGSSESKEESPDLVDWIGGFFSALDEADRRR